MLASDVVEQLKDRFDVVEVYKTKTHLEEFELKNSKDFSKGLSDDDGYGIRVVKDNRLAFAYFSNQQIDNFDKIAMQLRDSISYAKELECEIIPKDSYQLSRKRYEEINREDIKDKIYYMDSVAKGFDKRIIDSKSVSISIYHKEFEIANSFGLSASDSQTYAAASVSVLAKDKNSDAGWYSLDADSLDKINIEFVAKKAANMAINKLYPNSISTKKYSVVFANHVFTEILSHFFSAFDAYSLIEHTTMLEGHIGERVFSDNLTIKDAKSLPDRPNNVVIDDEGSRRMDSIVVEKGVLKGFLHNTYTANKLGMKNTGNAKRGSWKSLAKVGAFNFYIEGDSATDENKLLNKVDGVYITEIMGLHMANAISGDFSFGVNGFLIHNGELVSYFKSATLADNFFDMMKRVVGLSNNMYFSSSFGCCDVAIADCTIGGEGNG